MIMNSNSLPVQIVPFPKYGGMQEQVKSPLTPINCVQLALISHGFEEHGSGAATNM